MSTPNFDSRYAKPTDVIAAIAAQATTDAGQYISKTNNLSDLVSMTTARTNLGLGTAATQSTSAFDIAGAATSAAATLSPNATILRKVDRALRSKIRPSQGIALELNGTTYYLWHRLSPGQWLRTTIAPRTNTNGGTAYSIYEYVVVTPSVLVSLGGTGITETGTFTPSGSFHYSTTAGNTVTYTTPASTTRVGVMAGQFSNGGLSKVAINGDPTRARLLPQAGDLVERGVYPSSILTVNGGTLNFTDRVVDHYSTANRTGYMLFADDLAPGVQTVVMTTTGYQRTASSGTRTYYGGFLNGQAQVVGTVGTTYYTVQALDPGAGTSANEYAVSAKPAGGTAAFMGNFHDNEAQDSMTITVDGVTPTLTSAVPVFPITQAQITKHTRLLHPTAGSCANVTTIYTLERDGITVDVTIAWTQSMVVNAAFSMLALAGAAEHGNSVPRPSFDRGDLLEWGSGPILFTANASNPYLGESQSAAAWMWSSGNRYAAGLYIEDVLTYTNNWATSGSLYTNIQDRGSDSMTKIYISRVGNSGGDATNENVIAGTTYAWRAHYLFGTMDTPEKVFSA